MIAIASILRRSHTGADRGKYIPGLYASFDDDSLVACYPRGTAVDVVLASVAYANSGDSEDLRALLALEARDGNEEAAAWLAKYPA